MLVRQHPLKNSTVILLGCFEPLKSVKAEEDEVEEEEEEEEKLDPLLIQGTIEGVLFEMHVSWSNNENKLNSFVRDVDHINGLREKDLHVDIRQHVKKEQCQYVSISQANANAMTEVIFNREKLRPGTVIAFQVSLLKDAQNASDALQKEIFENQLSSFRTLIARCSLVDFNYLLYRCKNEENNDIYEIPGHGPLVYAGLQGIESILIQLRALNTEQMLKHPLCLHLKQGNWLMTYLVQRLKENRHIEAIGQWFEQYFHHIDQLPKYLIPVYFDLLIHRTYTLCLEEALERMSTPFVHQGSMFVKALAMTSVQMMGIVPNARLPTYDNTEKEKDWPSMAAGLPNFA